MTRTLKPLLPALALLTCGAVQAQSQAQATVKPDGQFRAAIGVGASHSTGNSRSSNLSLSADGVRAAGSDKTTLYASAVYARTEGVTTSEKVRLGGRHDHDLNPRLFAYGGVDFERNKFANLQLRSQFGAGIGYHVAKTDALTFDVFGGLAHTRDNFDDPMQIDGSMRGSYSYTSLMLAEESTHKLGSATTAKQRLALLPNLKSSGEYRATWDAGLAVAMSNALSLNVGFGVTYNSEPGPGRKSTDTLLTTGISVKFD